ncbi:hypothetical protein RRG08_011348 [Elysia crispata]|uniref:Uncharacterized protein n=1 Tax=Elysia crispata TaxID=231223 RepID=A0AAE1AJ95_9GAST|nr:hypothetical protein RRG08_011348 [Elysia crispata]
MAKSFRKGEKEKRAAKWPEGKEEEKAQLYGIRGKKLRDVFRARIKNAVPPFCQPKILHPELSYVSYRREKREWKPTEMEKEKEKLEN